MILWLVHIFLRPEFFGALALIAFVGYVYFKVTLNPLLAMVCEIAAVALLVAAAYAWADNNGAARVQAEWDADTARRIALTTAITNLWDKQRQLTEAASNERDQARRATFDAVTERNKLSAENARLRVSADAVRVLNDLTAAANAAGTAAKPDEAAAPATNTSEPADSNLGILVAWYKTVAEVHAECRDRVAAWEKFYAGLRAVQPKEALP